MKEENASFFQAVHIAFQQVVPHKVEIRFPVSLQVLSDDVCFGVECDAVLYGGMGAEEIIQHLCIFTVAFGV